VVNRWHRRWLLRGSRPGCSRKPGRCPLSVEQLDERCLLSNGFIQTNLISDIPGIAQATDPSLINPWGVALDSLGRLRFSVNHGGIGAVYDPNGQLAAQLPTVQVPSSASSSTGTSAPTAIVFNNGGGFDISEGGRVGPSLILFASADGTISGWNPAVDPNHAIIVVDNSSWNPLKGDVYTGLAFGDSASGTVLYAADFRTGTIEAFDGNFNQAWLGGSFTDPNIPAGFAPFNIQNIAGSLYVTYAKQDANKYGEITGPGNGYVDVFDTDGHLLRRLASQGPLDTPWGLALAPAQFGAFSNALLVGNLGDGHIDAYAPQTGAFLGALRDGQGNAITIAGLWGLRFASDHGAPTLFFTAGGVDQDHGLLGTVQLAADSSGRADASDPFGKTPTTAKDSYPLPPAKGSIGVADMSEQPVALPALLPLQQPLRVAVSPLSAAFENDRGVAPSNGPQSLAFATIQGTGTGSAAPANEALGAKSVFAASVDAFFLQSRPGALSLALALNDDGDAVRITNGDEPREQQALPVTESLAGDLVVSRAGLTQLVAIEGDQRYDVALVKATPEQIAPVEDPGQTDSGSEGRQRWLRPLVGVLLAFGARLAWGHGHSPIRIVHAHIPKPRATD
jgi:uncharacterized protein (TIGR03118 family)